MAILWEDLEAAAATGDALVVPVPGGESCSLQVIPVPKMQSLSLFAGSTWLCLLPSPAVSGLVDYSGLLAEEATACWYSRQPPTYPGWPMRALKSRRYPERKRDVEIS